MRMLWARCHSGSSVSAVNRPAPTTPLRRLASPPLTNLSKRLSSQISSTSSGPDTMSRVLPGVVTLKIGPYSAAMAMKPSIGLWASMSKALPTSGSPCGPGIWSSSIVVVMVDLRGTRCGDGVGTGQGAGRGRAGLEQQHDAQQHHPAGEDEQDRGVERRADQQERRGEVAHAR